MVGNYLRIILILLIVVAFTACAAKSSNNSTSSPAAGVPDADTYTPVPLMWEKVESNGMLWSAFTYQIIGNDVANVLLPGTQDVSLFCTNYANLSNSQKINFWAYLVSVLAKMESSFNPVMRQAASGTDSVTHQTLYKEGLLQLSYQDTLKYPACAFSWSSDVSLAPTDPQVSIFDPFKNLECGIQILAQQVQATHQIATTATANNAEAYWIILQTSNHANRISQIELLTQALPFCK
jgi:hypothetical protein